MFNKQYKNDEFLKTKLDEYIIEDKTAPDRLYTVSCDTVLNKFKNKENRKINIIEQLKIQSSFLSVGFWIISSVLLVSLGVLLAFIGEYQYTAVLFAVSPCIAIFGIPIILSSYSCGMSEIEKSCVLTLPQLIAGKAVILGSVNLVSILLSCVFVMLIGGFEFLLGYIVGFFSFSLHSFISLLILMKIKTFYAFYLDISVWLILSAAFAFIYKHIGTNQLMICLFSSGIILFAASILLIKKEIAPDKKNIGIMDKV